MKNSNITFRIPNEVIKMLKSLVGKQNMSKFVTKTLQSALHEKKEHLAKQYMEDAQDPEIKQVMDDWSILDSEGWE